MPKIVGYRNSGKIKYEGLLLFSSIERARVMGYVNGFLASRTERGGLAAAELSAAQENIGKPSKRKSTSS